VSAAKLKVAVQYAVRAQALPTRAQFRAWVNAALSGEHAGEVSVRVVDPAESKSLNSRYRRSDYATNVLAFPGDPALLQIDPEAPFGDIVICADVVEREAREQHKEADAHWAHLTVHGALHLAGYDHEDDAEAEVMEGREREVLAGLGFPDPYAA
jgi:probable rRNA maturation factor